MKQNFVESIAAMQSEICEYRRMLGVLIIYSEDKSKDTFPEFSDKNGFGSGLFKNIRNLHLKIEQLQDETTR